MGSALRWALFTELRGAPEPTLAQMLARLDPVDLILVEGFKREPIPKIEIHRTANGKPWLFPADPMVRAVAADIPPPADLPHVALDDIDGVGRSRPAPCGAADLCVARIRLMAQLSDDCFAFGGPLLSVEAAAALIAERVPPLPGREYVPLAAARGRVLAADVHAPLPLPPFFNSAVDGYALRHADLSAEGETRLPVVGRAPAGRVPPPLRPGTAMRIFTGAPMPAGADTVMMQEDAREEDGHVRLPSGLGARRQLPSPPGRMCRRGQWRWPLAPFSARQRWS